jgi:hypothetical protein
MTEAAKIFEALGGLVIVSFVIVFVVIRETVLVFFLFLIVLETVSSSSASLSSSSSAASSSVHPASAKLLAAPAASTNRRRLSFFCMTVGSRYSSTAPDPGNPCLSDQKPTDGCRTCDSFRVEIFMIIFWQRLDSLLTAENESERAF